MEQTNIIFPLKTPLPHGSSVIFHHFYTSKHALKWKIKNKKCPTFQNKSQKSYSIQLRRMHKPPKQKHEHFYKHKETPIKKKKKNPFFTKFKHDSQNPWSKFNTIRIQTHTNQKKKRQSPCISYEKFIKNFEKRSSWPGNRMSIRKTPPS